MKTILCIYASDLHLAAMKQMKLLQYFFFESVYWVSVYICTIWFINKLKIHSVIQLHEYIQIMLQCVHLCASYKCWEYCDTVNGRLTRYVIFFSSTILGWKAFAHEENSQLPEAEENAYKVNVKFCKFLFSRFFGVRTVSSWQCM